METICQEADRITHGDRKTDYGHPSVSFAEIAKLWSVYLGVSVTPEQVAMCQVLVKMVRLRHTPGHRDSLVDISGYCNCAGMILDKKTPPASDEELYKQVFGDQT